MTKVVYVKPALKKKRYRIQYKNVRFPHDSWSGDQDFRFKWQAVAYIAIVRDSKYDYRVVDTRGD